MYGSGLVVANLATLAAAIGLALLQATRSSYLPTRVERSAVVWFLAYPVAFFLGAPWAQSLLVCFAIWTLYALARRWWLLAAVCTLLACLTHITAICLLVPLLWSLGHRYLNVYRAAIAEKSVQAAAYTVATMAVVPIGFGILAADVTWKVLNPLLYIAEQTKYFGHHVTWPWTSLLLLGHQLVVVIVTHRTDLPRLLVDAIPLLTAIGLTIIAAIRRLLPVAHLLYVAALLLLILVVPVSGQQFPDAIVGAGRYLTAAIPLWLLLPKLSPSWPGGSRALLAFCLGLQSILTLYYLLGGWLV